MQRSKKWALSYVPFAKKYKKIKDSVKINAECSKRSLELAEPYSSPGPHKHRIFSGVPRMVFFVPVSYDLGQFRWISATTDFGGRN